MFDFTAMNYRIKPIISTKLNDLRKIICLRKFDVSIERISDCEKVGSMAYTVCHARMQNDVIKLSS